MSFCLYITLAALCICLVFLCRQGSVQDYKDYYLPYKFVILLLQFMKFMFIAQWCLSHSMSEYLFRKVYLLPIALPIFLLNITNKLFFSPFRLLEYILSTFRVHVWHEIFKLSVFYQEILNFSWSTFTM